MFAKEKGFTIKFENADNAEEEDNEGEEEEDEEDQKQQHKQPKQKESSKSSSSSSKQEQQQSSNGTSSRSTIAAGNEHLSYRERSDQVIGPTENCYLVEYVCVVFFTFYFLLMPAALLQQLTDDKVLKIRLFARAPTGRVEASSVEEDWSAYVDQYVNREYTAPELKPLAKVFLKRFVQRLFFFVNLFFNVLHLATTSRGTISSRPPRFSATSSAKSVSTPTSCFMSKTPRTTFANSRQRPFHSTRLFLGRPSSTDGSKAPRDGHEVELTNRLLQRTSRPFCSAMQA